MKFPKIFASAAIAIIPTHVYAQDPAPALPPPPAEAAEEPAPVQPNPADPLKRVVSLGEYDARNQMVIVNVARIDEQTKKESCTDMLRMPANTLTLVVFRQSATDEEKRIMQYASSAPSSCVPPDGKKPNTTKILDSNVPDATLQFVLKEADKVAHPATPQK